MYRMIMKVPHSHSEQLVNAGKNVKAALFELLSQYTANQSKIILFFRYYHSILQEDIRHPLFKNFTYWLIWNIPAADLELPNHDFSESELKFDIQLYNETLEEQFEGEFVFYILPGDSAELRSFDDAETTTRYRFRFADSDVEYIVFIAKNTEKGSQITEALQKAIPVLGIVILAVSIVAAFFYTVYMTAPIFGFFKRW